MEKAAITVAPPAHACHDDVSAFPNPERPAPGRKASGNVERVAKARDLIERLSRQVATPAQTREMVGLAGK